MNSIIKRYKRIEMDSYDNLVFQNENSKTK